MDSKARRAELKAFLRARRTSLTPEEVGLPRGPRRLTPGLRREEVASIAGVGVTWYTWLEQGREINVSDDTLGRVSRALKLSASDKAYLFTMVDRPLRPEKGTGTTESMQEVVDGFTAGPALMFGPRLDVLAHNALAEEVFSLGAVVGRFANNHVWRLFMDPDRRWLYLPGSLQTERNVVGRLRAHHAEHVGEPEFEELVEALTGGSPLFAQLWNERETYPMDTIALPLDHPSLGLLEFHSVRMTPADCPANLIAVLVPASEATVGAMRRLGGGAVEERRASTGRSERRATRG